MISTTINMIMNTNQKSHFNWHIRVLSYCKSPCSLESLSNIYAMHLAAGLQLPVWKNCMDDMEATVPFIEKNCLFIAHKTLR